jgi:hypothetical protein
MRRSLRFVVACGLAMGLLAGCVIFGPAAQQPSLIVTDLPGTWVSGDGASITFTSAGVVTATKFDFYKVIPKAISTCGVLSGTGTWQLHNPSSDYPPSPAGSPTNLVDLRFTSLSPPGSCSQELIELTSWDTGSKPGLCVQTDPDTPCDGYVFTKRRDQETRVVVLITRRQQIVL